MSGLVLVWTTRFPCLAELDSYLWAAMPFWEARLQVSLISADLSAEVRTDNAARLLNCLVRHCSLLLSTSYARYASSFDRRCDAC
ncbi:hypothetical protein [Serratia symbiotica]|uniref:hypothetical protein n=1 Tax=Serratia symbiotica TaxID=138074 RepID=UPI000310F5C8|nr:hypothetical protein [Serratia symbiotica]